MKTRQAIIFRSLLLVISLCSNLFFGQRNIDFYITHAKENSPVLNDYNNQVYSLKIDSLKMTKDFGFLVNGLGNASYAPFINNWGYNGAYTNNDKNIAAIVKVTKEFVGKENLKTRLNTFNLQAKQVQNKSNLEKLLLEKNIVDQYLNTYANQQQYAVLKEILHVFEQEDLILKKLTQASVFRQTDYLSFTVNHQQNQLALQTKYNDWFASYAQLSYLAGLIDFDLKNLEKPFLDRQISTDFTKSIYFENYKTDSLKNDNDLKIINFDYRPKIAAYADAGYSSSLTVTPYKNFGFSTGLSVNVPIFDGHKKQLLIEQNKINLETSKKYLEFNKNQFEQKSEMLGKQIKNYDQMIAAAKNQITYAKTLIDANLKQVPTGDVKIVDFIMSINNYLNLKQGLVQFELNRNLLINNLNHIIIP
ncbi:MAG: TolC family protein [Weeksellaceae bacterium]|nr:TolC family protein [Bacteroidota bacterium]MCG2781419.1 TolC family protein [Weeksellaceae bacterium]